MAANLTMLNFITFKTPVDLYKQHSQRYMLFCMTSTSEHPSFQYSNQLICLDRAVSPYALPTTAEHPTFLNLAHFTALAPRDLY